MTLKNLHKSLVTIIFLYLNSFNIALSEDINCDSLSSDLEKKNCIIEQKAKKLKENIKKKAEKVTDPAKQVKKRYQEFYDDTPKTLVDWFKKKKK